MTDHRRCFLECLCRVTAGEVDRRMKDYFSIGMEAGLSTLETNAIVYELEADGFVFTSLSGDIWLSRRGATLCSLLRDRRR